MLPGEESTAVEARLLGRSEAVLLGRSEAGMLGRSEAGLLGTSEVMPGRHEDVKKGLSGRPEAVI